MEKVFQEFPVDDELQRSNTELTQEEQDVDPPQDHDQQPQSPESVKEERVSLYSVLDEVEAKDQTQCLPDPPEDQIQVQGVNQDPPEVHDGRQRGGVFTESGPSVVDQDLLGTEQIQDQRQTADLDRASPQDQNQAEHRDQDQDQDLMTAAANRNEPGESGGSVPALVVTQVEESRPPSAAPVGPPVSPAEPSEPPRPERPSDLVIPAALTMFSEPSLSSSSDGGDMTCSDLLSLRSDSLSLASEPTVSRRSEEDDTRSVTASSVMSLFHRLQLDPLEKDWLRSSALGNMAAQRQLLTQDPSLVLKKDFITTALHWAAKQGRQEAVDMMLRFGADVNIRSGYTALHLASIHGHQHIVHALINTHNAKTGLRDYHGKTAVQYWSGCNDVFTTPDCQSGGRFSRGRRTQRYVLPSLLSRSRSQGQLHLDFGTVSQSSSHDVLDLQV